MLKREWPIQVPCVLASPMPRGGAAARTFRLAVRRRHTPSGLSGGPRERCRCPGEEKGWGSRVSSHEEFRAQRFQKQENDSVLFSGEVGSPGGVSCLVGWQGPRRRSCAFECANFPGEIAHSPALPCPWIQSCKFPLFLLDLTLLVGKELTGTLALRPHPPTPSELISPFSVMSLSSV